MMLEYDLVTAYHYDAYRPPLHQLILEKYLSQNQSFDMGLDIGCGVGHSSIALNKHAKQVIGIDPSEAMINRSTEHPGVAYQDWNPKDPLAFAPNTFDIITFAGSLFYAKSQFLLDEVLRVSTNTATVLVYDFEIHLEPILQLFQLSVPNEGNLAYNHQEDFSGLEDWGQLKELIREKEQGKLTLTATQLTHLLLSVKTYYQAFEQLFGTSNLEQKVNQQIETFKHPIENGIHFTIYYTGYQVNRLYSK